MKPVAAVVEELLAQPVTFLADCVGTETETACADPAPGVVFHFLLKRPFVPAISYYFKTKCLAILITWVAMGDGFGHHQARCSCWRTCASTWRRRARGWTRRAPPSRRRPRPCSSSALPCAAWPTSTSATPSARPTAATPPCSAPASTYALRPQTKTQHHSDPNPVQLGLPANVHAYFY